MTMESAQQISETGYLKFQLWEVVHSNYSGRENLFWSLFSSICQTCDENLGSASTTWHICAIYFGYGSVSTKLPGPLSEKSINPCIIYCRNCYFVAAIVA